MCDVIAAARGAARSELLRASSDRTPRGEYDLWLSPPLLPQKTQKRREGRFGIVGFAQMSSLVI